MRGLPGPTLDDADLEDFQAGYVPIRATHDNQAILDYCRDYLKDLKVGLKDIHGERTILAVSALIRWNCSSALYRLEGLEAAMMDMQTAVDEAVASGYHDVISMCFTSISSLFRSWGDYDTAAYYLQRALPYAWDIWPVNYLSVLQSLAYVWGQREETADKAVLMCDWMLMLQPKTFDTYMKRYQYILKSGYANDVENEANHDVEADCVAYAHNVAANLVLERHDHAIAAARAGRKLAREQEDFVWKEVFSKILTDEMERGH